MVVASRWAVPVFPRAAARAAGKASRGLVECRVRGGSVRGRDGDHQVIGSGAGDRVDQEAGRGQDVAIRGRRHHETGALDALASL